MPARATIAKTPRERAERILAMTTGPTRVVFIHDLWLHATSWAPWVELFRDAGLSGQQVPSRKLLSSSLGTRRPGQTILVVR